MNLYIKLLNFTKSLGLTSAAHVLKLESYREGWHVPSTRMTCKFVKRFMLSEAQLINPSATQKPHKVLLCVYHLPDTVLGTGNQGKLSQMKHLPLWGLLFARVCKDLEHVRIASS